jgi:hypothetical protein
MPPSGRLAPAAPAVRDRASSTRSGLIMGINIKRNGGALPMLAATDYLRAG